MTEPTGYERHIHRHMRDIYAAAAHYEMGDVEGVEHMREVVASETRAPVCVIDAAVGIAITLARECWGVEDAGSQLKGYAERAALVETGSIPNRPGGGDAE